MNKLVVHVITFSLGLLVAWLVFVERPAQSLDGQTDIEQTAELVSQLSTQQSDHLSENNQASALIKSYERKINQLETEINRLNRQLANSQGSSNNAKVPPQEQSEEGLRTMNMATFEESMKTKFTDQFKGVVLQLEGQRLDDIKQSFDQSNEKNEWSNQYENSIANFLADHDVNGDHYLQSLSCNTNVCRMEVNTNDTESWNKLYARMTNEAWYKSITIQEKSDYPGNLIYYLPSLNN